VVGVVSDVSPISKGAYAQIWVPCNLNGTGHLKSGFLPWDSDDMQDGVEVAILARSKADFPAIRREVAQHLSVFNASIVPDTLGLMDEPFEQADYYVRNSSFGGPTLHDIRIRHLIVYIILLLVPAVNLASMTQSRMRQRMSEIGVRRAFGAKRSTILFQVLMESLVQTILAGIIGLFLCFIVCAVWGYLIFAPDTWVTFSAPIYITASMLFHPAVFGWALLFCLILNLLSSGLPAWRASRINIVEALK
jgi:putative ABC transport system permease protein